ncbi:MAG: hypothetical protein KME43_05635 [Myxacorys chilensis ATA2-1-KO14]|nr:hypothetical protein [Myxacorys chilensis ATA2-1-KO14]
MTISAIADLSILENQTIALFCSIQCRSNLILKTYDLAAARRINYTTVTQ